MTFDPVKVHPIHGSLKRLTELLKSSQLSDLNDEIDEQRHWYLDRIRYLVRRSQSILNSKNKYAFNLNALNNLNSSSDSILNELNFYINSRGLSHIDNAFSQADQGFAIYLSQIDSALQAPPSDLGDLLQGFREASRSAIGELKANVGIAKKSLAELEAKVDAKSAEIEGSKEEARKINERLSATLNNLEQSQAETIKELFSKFEQQRNFWAEQVTQHKEYQEGAANYQLDLLRDKQVEAARIVQSVGDILTTGTYRDTAASETDKADLFRVVTIALFSVGIVVVLSNFIMHAIAAWNNVNFEESPWFIISRFATAFAVAIPAIYTARESARHRSNADRARQRELELTTLGPFIELLPSETKNKIRDRLTDRYFGSTVPDHEVKTAIDPDNISKISDQIINAIRAAKE